MTRPRMVLGGAVLALLLAGIGLVRWYENTGAPSPVAVTRLPTAEPRPAPAAGSTRPDLRERAAPPAGGSGGAAPAATAAPHPPTVLADPIMVHVVGAVRRPGVYRLAPRARLVDAVHAAGGPKAGADLEAVNLAGFVQDGEQIRVPALAEQRAVRTTAATVSSAPRTSARLPPSRAVESMARYPMAEPNPSASAGPGAAPRSAGKKDGGPVNINTADAEELETLPGVGPKTAAAIVGYRQAHGLFQRPEDLMEIRGIGQKKLARMGDRVRVR